MLMLRLKYFFPPGNGVFTILTTTLRGRCGRVLRASTPVFSPPSFFTDPQHVEMFKLDWYQMNPNSQTLMWVFDAWPSLLWSFYLEPPFLAYTPGPVVMLPTQVLAWGSFLLWKPFALRVVPEMPLPPHAIYTFYSLSCSSSLPCS